MSKIGRVAFLHGATSALLFSSGPGKTDGDGLPRFFVKRGTIARDWKVPLAIWRTRGYRSKGLTAKISRDIPSYDDCAIGVRIQRLAGL
jgi:hypothetical protein